MATRSIKQGTIQRRRPAPKVTAAVEQPRFEPEPATIQRVTHGLELLVWAVRGMKVQTPTPADLDLLQAELQDLSASLWFGGGARHLGPWLVDAEKAGSLAEIVARGGTEQRATA